MLDVTPGSSFNIKSLQETVANFTDTKPKATGGSSSSILVFEYQDPPGQCLNHTTVVPFFDFMKSNSRHKRIAGDETISGRMSGNEISFFTSGVTYELEWDDPLNYTLLGIHPSFFSRFFNHNSFDTFSILFDKIADDKHIRSLINMIIKAALNPNGNYSYLYIDHQATALISHLSYEYFGLKNGIIKNSLKHDFRNIINWIDYKIETGDNIKLEDVLELSQIDDPREFLNLFKNSIEVPLYVYCLRREMDIYKKKYVSAYQEINQSDIFKVIEIIDRRVQSNSKDYDYKNLNQEIEKTLFKNKDVVARYFRLLFGKTPEQFYRFRCLEKAKYLLITTSDSVEEIAKLCGFNSEDSLLKAFKKYVKTCPRDFRKKFNR